MGIRRISRDRLLASVAMGVCWVAGGTAYAADSSAAAPAVDEVVVTGARPFLSADTSGATGLPIAIEKVPQSISLVSAEFIKAADLKSIAEIAEYSAGAINAGNQLNQGSLIRLRGFNAGRAVDGLNVQGATQFEPDNAIVDRLEIVKGPSSVVYGVSSPGGLVNYVTKSAKADTPNYLYGQVGRWNSFRLEGQLAGALDAAEKIRGIAVVAHDQGDSYIDVLKHRTTTLYGGLDAELSDTVNGYIHGGYTRQVRTSFDGIPVFADGSNPPLPRSFFIGSGDMEFETSVYHAEGDVSWRPVTNLELSLKANYETSRSHSVVPYAGGLQPNGDVSVGLQTGDPIRNTNYAVGVQANYQLDGLGLEDSFVSVSLLRQDNKFSNAGTYFPGSATANIFAGEAAITRVLESLRSRQTPFLITSHLRTTTLAAQSVIHITAPLAILLGVSYANPDTTTGNGGVLTKFNEDSQVSYRAGVTYELTDGLNAYASFSQSFVPQTYQTASGAPLAPLEGDQYEAGLKYRSAQGRLLLTGAVFQITQSNQASFDTNINGADYYKALGEVRNKGFELEATGELTRQVQIRASYAYLDAKVTKDSNLASVGKRSLYLPEQTASLFSTYTFSDGQLSGFSIGAGARYVGSVRTSFTGATKDLKGYTLADAALSYTRDKWIAQVNVRNIFNKHYYINNYQTLYYGNVVGEPTNVRFSLQRQF